MITTRQAPLHTWLAIAVLAAVSILTPRAAFAAGSIDDLDFLAGSWCSEDGASEELWMPARGGLMLGLNRSAGSGGKVSFEYLRIERREDGIFYVASPQGGSPTGFKLVEVRSGRAVFENPEHDFPTRIVYELEPAGTLRARIEGSIEGKPRGIEWRWKKCG